MLSQESRKFVRRNTVLLSFNHVIASSTNQFLKHQNYNKMDGKWKQRGRQYEVYSSPWPLDNLSDLEII